MLNPRVFFLLAVLALALSGCVGPRTDCGNGICEIAEMQTCPKDCDLALEEEECVLVRAYWNKEEAEEGQGVRLVLESTGCFGKTALFSIYRKEDPSMAPVESLKTTVEGDKITVGWKAESEEQQTEYAFKVKVNPQIVSVNTLLVVLGAQKTEPKGAAEKPAPGEEAGFKEEGWYSWAKDKHNSRVADSALAVPLKVKWEKGSFYDVEQAYNFFNLYYQDGMLGLVKFYGIEGYDAGDGGLLWKHPIYHRYYPADGLFVIMYDYLVGGIWIGDHATSPYVIDVKTGERTNAQIPARIYGVHNVDESGLYSLGGTADEKHTILRATEFFSQPQMQPIPEGKVNGAFQFPVQYETFEYNDYPDAADYLTLDGSGLGLDGEEFTVMFWFNASYKYEPYRALFCQDVGWSKPPTLGLRNTDDGKAVNLLYSLFSGAGNVVVTEFSCPFGEWCHAAITYDHSKLKVFKDGALVKEVAESRDAALVDSPFYLGSRLLDEAFVGAVDEFAIFGRALTGEEIAGMYDKEIANDSQGLNLLYHFDNDASKNENAGFVYDWSGNGNHGIYDGHRNYRMKWEDRTRHSECAFGFWPHSTHGQIAVNDGVLYVPDGRLTAYNAASGEIIWEKGEFMGSAKPGNTVYTYEATYSDGKVYVIGTRCLGSPCNYSDKSKWSTPCLYGFNAANGNQLHSVCLSGFNTEPFVRYDTFEHIIQGNTAYISWPEKIAAYNISAGTKLWEYARSPVERGSSLLLEGAMDIVLSGNLLYAVDGAQLVALDTKNNGRKVWQFVPAEENYSELWFEALIIADNTLFAALTNGKVFAFEQGSASPEIITEEYLPDGIAGMGYGSKSILVEGGQGPFNWEVVSGSLPSGLALEKDRYSQHSSISGTPLEPGSYSFTARATDAKGNTAEKEFSITVSGDLSKFLELTKTIQQGLEGYTGCEDSYIHSYTWDKEKNFGDEGKLYFTKASNEKRTLLKFKIFESEDGPVPDDAIITGADLILQKFSARSGEGSVYELLRPWEEQEVSWNNASSSQEWSVPGADSEGADRSEKKGDYSFNGRDEAGNPNFVDSLDVTPFVRRIQSGTENKGWLFKPVSGDVEVCSSEYSNHYPVLDYIGNKQITAAGETISFKLSYTDADRDSVECSWVEVMRISLYGARFDKASCTFTWTIPSYIIGTNSCYTSIFKVTDKFGLSDSELIQFCEGITSPSGSIPQDTPVVSTEMRPKLEVRYKRFDPDNKAPVARIYLNPSMLAGSADVLLDGSESYDPDGEIIRYEWYFNYNEATGRGTPVQCKDFDESMPWMCKTGITCVPRYCQPYYITLKVYDDYGVPDTDTIIVTPVASFDKTTITTTRLRNGALGAQYSDFVYVEGGSGYTWSKVAGSLPPGLQLNSATGAISGVPSAVGTYNFSIMVAGTTGGSATQQLSILVLQEGAAPPECNEGETRQCGSSNVGECSYGTQTCAAGKWGPCTGSIEPKAEICDDNKDNDCDTLTDCDDADCLADPACIAAECVDKDADGYGAEGTDLSGCSSSTTEPDCDDSDAAINPGASEVPCNDVDEDCNPANDMLGCECTTGQTRACGSSDVGECKYGTQQCAAGKWGPCTGSIEPTAEKCDGKDNDCDGSIDEHEGDCSAPTPYCVSGICVECGGNADCDNGLFCDGEEACVFGACEKGTAPEIDDGIDCTVDACDETSDRVVHTPSSALCQDGLWCNGVEACNALTGCVAGAAPDCDDGIACTIDSCSEGSNRTDNAGSCKHDTDPCDCTKDSDCDDDNPCTDDTCTAALACRHTNNDARACDDGLYCTVNDRCSSGACISNPRPVNDEVACTIDSCDESAKSVLHIPNNALCDDGQWCNGMETCDTALDCILGIAPICNDKRACTTDSCNEATDSCLFVEIDADGDNYSICSGPNQDCDDSDAAINPGASEVPCNDVDEDCDASNDMTGCECITDQARACGSDVGECEAGTQTCIAGIWSRCFGAVGPEKEICDGLDNDCDGKTDNDLVAPPCSKQLGVCKGKTKRCSGAPGWLECNATDYGEDYESTETKCADGLDNDCDDKKDEGDEDCTPAEECSLSSLSWSKQKANEGQKVRMLLEGSKCEGEEMNITIMEKDVFSPDDLIETMAGIAFSNSTDWTAKFVRDETGLPSYYFIVEIADKNYQSGLRATELLYVVPKNRLVSHKTFELKEGKNTFSLPLMLDDMNIASIFKGIKNKVEKIYTYDNGWKIHYFDSNKPSNLFELEPGKGYVVFMKKDADLKIRGSKENRDHEYPTFRMSPGWHLIGTFSKQDYRNNILADVRYSDLYRFNKTTGEFERVEENVLLGEEESYWIYVTEESIMKPIFEEVKG